jgi:hypothetical protein
MEEGMSVSTAMGTEPDAASLWTPWADLMVTNLNHREDVCSVANLNRMVR